MSECEKYGHDWVYGEAATPDGGRVPMAYCSRCGATMT